MEIVLIRHGEPEWVRDGLNVVDPPLTERGHRQAERVAAVLDGQEFDEIVSRHCFARVKLLRRRWRDSTPTR